MQVTRVEQFFKFYDTLATAERSIPEILTDISRFLPTATRSCPSVADILFLRRRNA
jgi:hypothetical protein